MRVKTVDPALMIFILEFDCTLKVTTPITESQRAICPLKLSPNGLQKHIHKVKQKSFAGITASQSGKGHYFILTRSSSWLLVTEAFLKALLG
jgi:hypothetical protein